MMDVSHFLFVVSQERSFFPLTFSRWPEANVSRGGGVLRCKRSSEPYHLQA